ncbi:MAG: phosphate ABC transporter permease subunit PstC [Acidimicrobiales bacterium]|nr:phosphate ABC transporter permease subunit PstC [Acidimicrobiales bacterium]HRW36532.1 phosphate ABC transporter permease subunit PstC [Aquihabitans sp.]
MTTIDLPPNLDDTASVSEGLASTTGAGPDRAFRGLAVAAGVTVLVVLALITYSTTKSAWPAFSKYGSSYFFSTDWRPNSKQFGILGFVWGTAVISFIGILLAVPTSIGIALFATEVAPQRLRRSITTVMDLLASVPSVVFGLVGFYVLRNPLQDLYRWLGDAVASIPLLNRIFGQDGSGISLLTAGIVLAIMITPIITTVTREVFETVPRNDKEGALALGATRWEMVSGVILPHSLGGITGAVMLGLGRAMGETIAVTLLIGAVANPEITIDVLSPGEAMPAAIARKLPEAAGDFRAALIGLGVTLFVITMVVNVASRRLVDVVDRRLKGAA